MINKILYWAPRILAVIFILLVLLLSLDVFSEYKGWMTIRAFFIHCIPSFILLIITIFAWKYDLVGAIAFLGCAVFYFKLVGFNRPWSWYLVISGPLAITGILFLLNWLINKRPGDFFQMHKK